MSVRVRPKRTIFAKTHVELRAALAGIDAMLVVGEPDIRRAGRRSAWREVTERRRNNRVRYLPGRGDRRSPPGNAPPC